MHRTTDKVWNTLDIIKWGEQYLCDKHIEMPRLCVEMLLGSVLQCRRIDLYTNYDKPLNHIELSQIKSKILECAQGMPIQYIIGEVEFYDTTLKVTPDVLIPRPETEILVDQAVSFLQNVSCDAPTILDLGTGSGNIAIALAKKIPTGRVYAADISEKALAVAEQNAQLNNVENRITFFKADIMHDWQRQSSTTFDIIVSNPPYINTAEMENLPVSVKKYEPHEALLGGIYGTEFYERIINYFSVWLKPEGKLFFEIGIGQEEKITSLLNASGFMHVETTPDLHNIARVIAASK